MKPWFALAVALALAAPAVAAPPPEPAARARPLPIIDMHMHARAPGPIPAGATTCAPNEMWPRWDPATPIAEGMVFNREPPCDHPIAPARDADEVLAGTREVMERRNIIAMVSGRPEDVARWKAAMPGRVVAMGLDLRLRPYGPPNRRFEAYSVDQLKAMYARGEFQVLGEVMSQYEGMAPNDPRLEPYWAFAEAMDIPVGIHMGGGAGGDPYQGSGVFRARHGDPLLLEDVLVAHPKLRVWIMHAGYPLGENLRALMFTHPQVYVDVAAIVWSEPRPAFWRWLREMVEAGFGDRIMFGTDHGVWPGVIERAIAAVEDAPFLTEGQKRDILYENAARFLRFSEAERGR